VTDDGVPRAAADADAETREAGLAPAWIELLEGTEHVEGRAAAARGVVFGRRRRSPERHDGVADVLVEETAVGEHDVGHRLEVLAQYLAEGLGRQLLRDAGEAPDVREEHADEPPLPAQAEPRRLLGDQVGDLVVHVVAEGGADPPLLSLLHPRQGCRAPPTTAAPRDHRDDS